MTIVLRAQRVITTAGEKAATALQEPGHLEREGFDSGNIFTPIRLNDFANGGSNRVRTSGYPQTEAE